eukprot:TRINITY_DN9012_c0_g1_i1.p1 TRINITY_DN9012_c0_g1~~TRINITY_DN9012_c0_g1_i1.p1  ORF type:complete len:198 (+),score=21.71 TRINITY_DN9012_c0_g1_i1:98-691(+)
MTRVLRILFHQQLLPVLFVFMRNLLTVATHPKNQEEDDNLQKMFSVVCIAIHTLYFPDVLMVMKSWLSSLPDEKLVKTIKSRIGISVVSAFLSRGYEETLKAMAHHSMPYDTFGVWKNMIEILYRKLTGKFPSLLSSTISAGYSNDAVSSKVWDFFIVLTCNSTAQQKQILSDELRHILRNIDITPSINSLLHHLNT